jgi:hypothetical protein
MPKPKKRRIHECAYCGETKETTRDHVIPKALFTKPYPRDLITVPACDTCNGIRKSANDTLLRDILTTDVEGSNNPTAQKLFTEKVLEAHQRNQSPFTRNIIKDARLQPLYTGAGVFLGDYYMLTLPSGEVENLFEFLIRGLYYSLEKQRIPDTCQFEVKRYLAWEFKRLLEYFLQQPITHSRTLDDVFGYACMFDSNYPCHQAWLLWFYNRVGYSVLTEETTTAVVNTS